MIPTKEQLFILAPDLLEIWENHNLSIFTRDPIKYLYDLIVFNDAPDVIHRKIKELYDFERIYIPTTDVYMVLYSTVFGDYENLPLYVNYDGYGPIINWRLRLKS